MKEMRGDLFSCTADAICVTTNGFVKKNGDAVMGMGCAKTLKELYPVAPKLLGQAIKEHGNVVNFLGNHNGTIVMSFPVKASNEICETDSANVVDHNKKKYTVNNIVPGFACKARLKIIERSARDLVRWADHNKWQNVIIPRPGCGAGELDWNDVKPVLDSILDDRFTAITF